MSRPRLERRLTDLGDRLRDLRAEARIGAEQLAMVAGDAEDARVRALVSDSPMAVREHQQAERHVATLARDQHALLTEIAELEHRQDELLDELAAGNRA